MSEKSEFKMNSVKGCSPYETTIKAPNEVDEVASRVYDFIRELGYAPPFIGSVLSRVNKFMIDDLEERLTEGREQLEFLEKQKAGYMDNRDS